MQFNREGNREADTEGSSIPGRPGARPVHQSDICGSQKGRFRPVANLKALNRYMKRLHFKMEGAHLLKDLLHKGDCMVFIDLKDTYLSVPVAQQYRHLLRFM